MTGTVKFQRKQILTYIGAICTAKENKSDGGQQGYRGIARVPMAQRGVGQVKGHREDYRKGSDGHKEWTSYTIQTKKSADYEGEGEEVRDQEHLGDPRIRVNKVVPGRIGATPGNDDSPCAEVPVQGRMHSDEAFGGLPFLIKKDRFPDLSVTSSLLVTRDAICFTRVRVEDWIVARPKLVSKIRTKRNESMELDVVANSPRQANEKNHGTAGEHALQPLAFCRFRAPQSPGQEKR